MTNFIGNGDQPVSLETMMTRYDNSDLAEHAGSWRNFLEGVLSGVTLHQVLSDFIARIQQAPDRPVTAPRVFISHRQDAIPYALRIAYLASVRAGMDYWLDVHDPLLTWLTTASPSSNPRYAAIVAGIIEMALLGCTHVIAAHTPPATQGATWVPSLWIPYEFGRAKSRTVYSTRAAGWFHPAARPPTSRGEYVLLAARRFTDAGVEDWLKLNNPHSIAAAYHGGSVVPPALP
jgi:hypothetical protein